MRTIKTMLFLFLISLNLSAVEVKQVIKDNCSGIRSEVVMALIEHESSFVNNNSVDDDGITNFGLMKIRYGTAKGVKCGVKSVDDLMNHEKNIKCGCKYLQDQLKLYGTEEKMLLAYNAGKLFMCRTGVIKRTGKPCLIGKYTNQKYADAILKKATKYADISN